MSSHDFKGLHDKEFEALCADLLGVSMSVRFERFKPGPDQGVDALRVLTLFEVPLVELFEVGSQFRFRRGVERVGTGTGNSGVCWVMIRRWRRDDSHQRSARDGRW